MSSYRRRLLLANQGEENLYLYGNSVQAGTPTPEAPIDIMSVDNPTIKVTGKNLFKSTNYTKGSLDSVTGDMSSNTLAAAYCLTTDYIFLKNGDYIIKNKTGANLRYICFYNANKEFKSATWTARAKTFKFNVEEDSYIRIDVEKDGNVTIDNFDTFCDEYEFILNEGSVALPYEPYEEEHITIDETTPFGKNWFNNDFSLIKQVSYITQEGSSGTRWGYELSLPINTYTIKPYQKDFSEEVYIYGCVIDDNNIIQQKVDTIVNTKHNTITFTIKKDWKLLIYDGWTSNKAHAEKFFSMADLMLNEGTTALPYEPYIPPITSMRGIGDYKDRIYTKDGKVWFEQLINYVKLTRFAGASSGSATINSFSGAITPKVANVDYPYVTNSNQISNIGVYEVTYSKTGKLHWYIAREAAYLIPPDAETWTNVTEAFEYLMSVTGNVPMEYQYVLATPITTEITGYLAEKILAIDKTKNITITSENGVSGSVEVID